MVNVSSLPVVGGSAFDLDSHKGVTQLLVSIRASAISIDDKNDVRDLVFQYTNGGKDATVRRALEQKISALGIEPVAPKATTPPLPPPPLIGTFRAAPAFVIPTVVAKPSFAPEPVVSVTPIITEPPSAAAPVPPPISVPVPEPVHQSDPVSSVVNETDVKQMAPVTPVMVEAKEVSVPDPVSSADDNQVYLNRIREIKAIVNERVGNPVNLVDIDNAVGREYMSALLDAMKKLNSGSSPVPAMRRLEAAFAAVEETLEKHDRGELTIDQPEVPASAAVTEREAYSIPVSLTPEEPIVPVAPISPMSESVVAQPWQVPEPVSTPASYELPDEREVSEAHTGWNAVPTKTIATPLVHSLAESEPPKTPASLPLTRVAETAHESGDPLHTEEVNEGLEQLLLEWSLFKKSGLFGTGPKGREHPLFKKIAGLQIPLLLAGRFEGATQEIKQSITDYMNGWRYEQGIIYEPGELFEHYLRRVIRHILDLQKNKIR